MRIGVGFEEDFADILIGIGGFAFGHAAQDGVFGAAGAIFGVLGLARRWRVIFAGSTISISRQSFERSDFPVSRASGVRQSELSFTLARLTVRSAGT